MAVTPQRRFRRTRQRFRTKGGDSFYQVEIKRESTPQRGNIYPVRNKRAGKSWETQKWLIGKKLARIVKQRLIAAEKAWDGFKSKSLPVIADRFTTKRRLNAIRKNGRTKTAEVRNRRSNNNQKLQRSYATR